MGNLHAISLSISFENAIHPAYCVMRRVGNCGSHLDDDDVRVL